MDIFNELSKEKKRDLFIGVYNLMVRSQRYYGWVVYMGTEFLFFDSKPSFVDCFDCTTDDLIEWIEGLK